jgi:hypothetical protein
VFVVISITVRAIVSASCKLFDTEPNELDVIFLRPIILTRNSNETFGSGVSHPDYEQIAIANGPTNYMHTANLSGQNEIRRPQLAHLRAYGCRAYSRTEDV